MSLDWDWNDVSGNGNNGTPTAVTKIRKNQSEGWIYNWSTSYISVPDFAYNMATSFTYNAWIKVNNYSDANGIIQHDKWTVAPFSRWTLFRTNITTWELNFIRLNSAWSILTNITSASAIWTWIYKMVTAVFDNTVWSKIYIDWVQVASDAVLTNTNDCTAPIWIWCLDVSAPANLMDWNIFSPKIRNRALSDKEVEAEYYLNYLPN